MANAAEGQETQRDDLSFQGPTASFAIQKGVFCTICLYSAKGLLVGGGLNVIKPTRCSVSVNWLAY